MSVSSSVFSATALVREAIANVDGPLQQASREALAPVAAAVSAALGSIDAQIILTESLIDQSTVGGIAALTPSPVLSARLLLQTQLLLDLTVLRTVRGYLARVGVNVANAPG